MGSTLDEERLAAVRRYIEKREDDNTTADEMVAFFEPTAVVHENGIGYHERYKGHAEIKRRFSTPPDMKATCKIVPVLVEPGGDICATAWAGSMSRTATFSFQRGTALIRLLIIT